MEWINFKYKNIRLISNERFNHILLLSNAGRLRVNPKDIILLLKYIANQVPIRPLKKKKYILINKYYKSRYCIKYIIDKIYNFIHRNTSFSGTKYSNLCSG